MNEFSFDGFECKTLCCLAIVNSNTWHVTTQFQLIICENVLPFSVLYEHKLNIFVLYLIPLHLCAKWVTEDENDC